MAQDIIDALFVRQDRKYQAFSAKLVPNIPADTVIGVRAGDIKQLAKEFAGRGDFLAELPHRYLEENQLHAQILNLEKDFAKAVSQIECFLPFVDNWAVCDSLRPKAFEKHVEALIPLAFGWCASPETYTMRFGVEMLMTYCLESYYSFSQAEMVASLRPEDYYGKMMIAWYFATALAKQYDSILPILASGQLERWTHNKTIQKAVESYRITPEQKTFLKTLKRK